MTESATSTTSRWHWSTIGIRNNRLLILMIAFLVVGGLSSFSVLPRMEDPVLTPRAATVTTLFSIADAEQVEALVTDRIEKRIREVEEIKEIRSQSRSGVSFIMIELRDDVYDSGPVWSRIRGKVEDSIAELPPEASRPQFDTLDVRAFAWIGALVWKQDSPANYAILGRFAEHLEDQLRGLPGTDDAEQFGRPSEEISVSIDPAALSNLGLAAGDIAAVISSNDARSAAGSVESDLESMPVELANQLGSINAIRQIPVKENADGNFVVLGDIAQVDRIVASPPDQLGQVDGRSALMIGVMLRSQSRIDHWRTQLHDELATFRSSLPPAIELVTVLDQNTYVQGRLTELVWNLVLGSLAVMVVVWVLMGWRNAIMVSTALPLVSLAVLSGMRLMGVPIHQMSVAGLIIALGLLIDNAIVIVDSVSAQLRSGKSKVDAVSATGRILFIPLLASTLTTAFAFAPICLMEGPAGEFVGSMASNVILAVGSSLFISLLIIAPLATMLNPASGQVSAGIPPGIFKPLFQQLLARVIRFPKTSMLACGCIAALGFAGLAQLPDQFFPPADRDQFHIELELPQNASFGEMQNLASAVSEELAQHPRVERTTWLIGRSVPTFYYNIITRRQNAKEYAQCIVKLDSNIGATQIIRQLQHRLQRKFPEARLLARQLEQGPPFAAPIEVRFFGPDLNVLRNLGEATRKILSEIPDVVHIRAELNDATPTVQVDVAPSDARLAGLQPGEIAGQLQSQLSGAVGGFVLQQTEQLPVRVRVAGNQRATFADLQGLDLVSTRNVSLESNQRVPLTAVANLTVKPKTAMVARENSIRMQEVQAYLTAGVLASKVLKELKQRIDAGEISLPPGYRMKFGGEASKRSDAVGNLLASVGVLVAAIVMTLVLSIGSFRAAAVIGLVAVMAIGFGGASLYLFGYPFGFMAIVGIMGLIGVAINDSIVVLTALREDPRARTGDRAAIIDVTLHESRHVLATTFTTIAGFVPLILSGGGFWPPMAIAVAGGVVGCTIMALIFIPGAFSLLTPRHAQN